MNSDSLYRFTSIGRPLDTDYPTNRAVLVLMLAAAVVSGLVHAMTDGINTGIALAALNGLLTVFGSWALVRELAPDNNPAAFVGVTLAYGALLWLGTGSFLLLFTTLLLVRIVNRTTGLAPRIHDSIAVLGLSLFAMWQLSQPLLGVVAALAFLLDATLHAGERRQLVFAAIALAGGSYLLLQPGSDLQVYGNSRIAVAVISGAYLVSVLLTRDVLSPDDTSGERLSVRRVQAGMLVGWLVAAQAYLAGASPAAFDPLMWCSIAAVPIGSLFAPRTSG